MQSALQKLNLMAKSENLGVTSVTGHQQQPQTSDQEPEQVGKDDNTDSHATGRQPCDLQRRVQAPTACLRCTGLADTRWIRMEGVGLVGFGGGPDQA